MAQNLQYNVYIDPSYTSAITGSTHPVTGEVLTWQENAFNAWNNNRYIADANGAIVGAGEGFTAYYTNIQRGGNSLYNDGVENVYVTGSSFNYIYAYPKGGSSDAVLRSEPLKVYIENSVFTNSGDSGLYTLGQNVQHAGFTSDIEITIKNTRMSALVLGGGDAGDSNNNRGKLYGDITFDISDSAITNGDNGNIMFHKGAFGTVETPNKITGTITNTTVARNVYGLWLGGSNPSYADIDITISGSSVASDIQFGRLDGNGGGVYHGTGKYTIAGSTAANIRSNQLDNAQSDATFTLVFAAHANETVVSGAITGFDSITVDAGAKVRATSIAKGTASSSEVSLNLAVGSALSVTNLTNISVINVTGELVQADTVIISGLTITELSSSVIVNGTEYHSGFFPGQFEIVNGDLIIHSDAATVLLINSNYTDGEATELGPTGYSTFAAAQAAVVDKATTTLMVTVLDDSIEDPNVFTADVLTKDYTTALKGEDGDTISLDGNDLVIGDDAADSDSANVSVSYTDNINALRFGNITGTAKVAADHLGDDEETQLGTLDLTGAAVGNAQVTVEDSVIGDVLLADQADFVGTVTVKNSTIANVYNAQSGATNDLSVGNKITKVVANGDNTGLTLGTSTVETFIAGSEIEGASFDSVNFDGSVNAETLVIGGNANNIGSITAIVKGGEGELASVVGKGDTVADDVNVTFDGGVFTEVVVADDATVGGDVNLVFTGGKFTDIGVADNATINGDLSFTLGGGTVASMRDGTVFSSDDENADTFPGIVYGASVTGTLDGAGSDLTVLGNAKINKITNFSSLSVLGGTLNVSGGDGHDSEYSEDDNVLEIDGDILNKRAISAGTITANDILNYGLIGTKRDSDSYDATGIVLTGDLLNAGYIKTSGMDIGGDFTNTGKVTATGDISVDGDFSNSGELFFRSVFSTGGVFTQDAGLELNGVNVVNTGFISTGKLTGVKNLTTSKLYVTGGAEIDGNITIEAGAEVAFTNKADSSVENGLTLSGRIYMGDTSHLVVSGILDTTGTKTITINVGDLIGSNEVVHAEGGVNSWNVTLAGAKAGLYEAVKTDTTITVYSLDKLYVNSKFSADGKNVADGNTLVYGKNAFATVAEAVAASKSGAKIIIYNDKTGMDVDASARDVELVNSKVGEVTAKTLSVASDSTVTKISAATSLVIDASAALTVTDTLPTDLHIVIDAEKGSGSRLILDVDPEKVALSTDNVVVLAPAGKDSYAPMILSSDPEAEAPKHVGDLFLVSSDNSYYAPALYDNGTATFVDGDTFDAATGDALFDGVNTFATTAEAIATAKTAGGVYVIVDSLANNAYGDDGVTTMFEVDYNKGGSDVNRSINGAGGAATTFTSDEDHTTIIAGTTARGNIYGLCKYYDMDGDFTFIAQDSLQTANSFYITGNSHTNVMNGDITAEISGSTFQSTYIGYGNFGTDENAPIDIDITIRDSRVGAFFGIETQANNLDVNNRQDINANINIKMYDSVCGGTFTVLNTRNEHWNGRGATLLQTYFTAGSINVEIGGSTFGDNIRNGLSLELAGKAPQAFNVANTLHIVATEKNPVTQATYLCEWDTIIVDATARLNLNTLQYTTTAVVTEGQTDAVLDNRGTLTQVMINMSGYKSGTHMVISASGSIYTDSDLSNITVIGDNDLTGQCQLAYGFSGTQLKTIAVFDKADDMYVNAGYTDAINGTTVGGQELLLGYNAHTEFDAALGYASEWGGTIVVTGGVYEQAIDFNGNNVDFQAGAMTAIDMGSRKASTLKVSTGATFEAADGAGASELEIVGDNVLGDATNFTKVSVSKGAEVTLGDVTGANLSIFADNVITVSNLDVAGKTITVDVDGFIGASHVVISADALTGFDTATVTITGEDFDKYSLIQNGNELVLKTTLAGDTYVNSEYSEATTGLILPDGTYLEYGFNAFSSIAEGIAALGSGANTVTVTGGSFTENIDLTGLSGIVFGDNVTVNGNITGDGAATLTVGDGFTVGSISGVSQITLQASSLLSASFIDLNDGTIVVQGSERITDGNLSKVITTQAGISGVTYSFADGFAPYKSGNDLYVLDASRIYVFSDYSSSAIDGTTAYTGDTLVYDVNAFPSLNDAAQAALAKVPGGTLFAMNWSGDLRPTTDASIVAQGSGQFSVVFGNNGGAGRVVNDDIVIHVTNAGMGQYSTAMIHGNDDNAKWTFNGNVEVILDGTGIVNASPDDFAVIRRARFGENATLTITVDGSDGKAFTNDFTPLRYVAQGDYDSMKKITFNFVNMQSPNDKWIRLFSSGNGKGDNFTGTSLNAKDVELNIVNSYFRAGNTNWSIALTNGAEGSRNTNFTIHLTGATVEGLVSGVRNRDQNSPGNGSVYEGTRTAIVDGADNKLARLIMINHLVVDANSSLILSNRDGSYGNNVAYGLHFLESNSSGKNSITIDVTNYEGADKMVVSTPTMGIAQRALAAGDVNLVLKGDEEGKFMMGLGLTKGVFIITANGDVVYNAAYSANDNGTAFSNTFAIFDDSEDASKGNAFADYDLAKLAIENRAALGLERNLFVSGIGDDDEFYADGYAVTITDGAYEAVYGTDDDDEIDSVASVNIKITGGTFDKVAVAAENNTVVGDALIELAGGTFGIPVVYEKNPEDPENPAIEEDEVPATIDGSKDLVGGVSKLVVSKDLAIAGEIVNFDEAEVTATLTVTGDFEADVITIDANKKLTVQGDTGITADSIIIDATNYNGPTKALVVSNSFNDEQPAVTINGDLDVYSYTYVEDTLYLVSKNAGNVYLNSTWDESISGDIYNGELLVWGVNAFADATTAISKATTDYTLYVLGGSYDVFDVTGVGQVKLDIRGGSFNSIKLGEGADSNHRSVVDINAGTNSSAVVIGSIAGVEGSTIGYILNAMKDATITTIDGVRYLTFGAGNVSIDGVNFLETNATLTVDFADYAGGAGIVLQTVNGIENFIKYNVEIEGETVSRTVVGNANNADRYMVYYDEDKKAVIAVERGDFALLDPNASNEDNGTVVTIDGKTATMVYGYNVDAGNVNVGRYVVDGGTVFAGSPDEKRFYWFFTNNPVSVDVNNIYVGGFVAGYNSEDETPGGTFRDGEFTANVSGSTINWFAAFAGQGTSNLHQDMIVGNWNEDDEEYEDTVWNITLTNGMHDTNAFYIARYANLSGGTVNVSFTDYELRGDLQLFNRIFNGKLEAVEHDELKEANVTLTNVQAPASKWCYIWAPQEDNSTHITLTITDSNFVGNDFTIGLFGGDIVGTWNGEADVYISGMTMTQGRLGGDKGTGGGGVSGGSGETAWKIDGTRTLHVTGGTNNIQVVRQFTNIQIVDGAFLTGGTITLAEGRGFTLIGDANYSGPVKEFAVVGSTINGAVDAINSAEFVDEDGYEIDGYGAAVGARSVFIYKNEGDVFYNGIDGAFTADITGSTIVESDGTVNYLVFGDNAVSTMVDAYAAMDNRTNANIIVVNALTQNLYTNGYKTIVNGGQITNLSGVTNGTSASPADDVASVDITVNNGASIANVVVATEFSQVSGDALITVADGYTFTGTLNGASDFVGGDSVLVFEGDAKAKAITSFDNVTIDANNLVTLTGEFTGDTITIDASAFAESTKKVLYAEGGFGDTTAITVNVLGEGGYGYEFLDDGKTLLVTSALVTDVFVNADWTEADVEGKFVGEMALVWDKNAFNNFADALAAVGEGYAVTIAGGSYAETLTVTDDNDVVISANTIGTAINAIVGDGGEITIANGFTADSISGFSGLTINPAASTDITVGGIELLEGATLTVDVTGYNQVGTYATILDTDTGITNLDAANITVTGTGANKFIAFYDEESGSVQLLQIDKYYVDPAFGPEGEGIVPGQTSSITGQPLVFGKNAFYSMNDILANLQLGQEIYVNGSTTNADISTNDKLANVYISGSTTAHISTGFTTGDKLYTGDLVLTIVDSTFATAGDNYLVGNVTNDEPWNHQNRIIGSLTLDVVGSTMGVPNDYGNMLRVYNYTHFYGTEEAPALVQMNFTDVVFSNDIEFIGDSPVGKPATINDQAYVGADVEINLTNVDVPAAKWWRFQTGNQESQGTVTFNVKNSTFASQSGTMRLALDNDWGTGWGAAAPICHSDFVFNFENTSFNGYLLAGRLSYTRDDAELTSYDGAKILNITGETTSITNTFWFKNLNVTAGATFLGTTLRMATTGSAINVDATGYEGKSKVVISMANAFENITMDDDHITLTADPESEYSLVYSDRVVVIKGGFKDIYANSTYTAENVKLGDTYNDDLLFFGENAFNNLTDAVAALTEDAVLFVTGGELAIAADAFAFSNSITVDATAKLTYAGSDAITIDGDLVNDGSFKISAAGFVDGSQTDVLVLSATSISGAGSFTTDDDSYTVTVSGTEVHLTLKKGDVYVSTDWADLPAGTTVTIGEVEATIGDDAFATADAAAAAIRPNGNLTVVAGDVSFTNGIIYNAIALTGSTVRSANVGGTTAVGSLTVESGAVAINASVRATGTLTVDAGATVTGTFGMLEGAAVSFAAGSVLDFNISELKAGGTSALVTNLSVLTGTPDYKITLADEQEEGTYMLATSAASFSSTVTLQTADATLGTASVSKALYKDGLVYTLAVTENNELTLTIAEGEPPTPPVTTIAYMNSDWAGLEDGTIVTIGDVEATIGVDAFADLGSAEASVTSEDSVEIVGGTVSFADGYSRTITVDADATVIGTASFLNFPITINGTMAFDVALTTRTTAQFADIQFVSGDTQYTLTFEKPTEGVYMLAAGLWYDDLYQPVFNGSVTFGDAVLTVGNDVTIDGLTYGLRTTSNLELLLVVDKAAPAPTGSATILSACINGEDDMIGRMSDSETTGIASTTQFYWSTGDAYGAAYALEDGWTFAGIGDFNGDGKDDMLRYCTEGDAKGYVIADMSLGGGLFTPTVVNVKNASWDILGTGDFNGDGSDDVLVANRTAASASIGLLGYWAGGTTWTLINGYSDEWTLVDTGDYDGNGCTDMLWKNTFIGDGDLTYNAYCTWRLGDLAPETYDWTIVMVTKVNETEEKDSDAWSFIGTGDFNGDGVDDIVMQNDFGVIAINTMSTTGTPTNWVIYNQIADDVTRVATIADIDGNGCDDIVLAGLEDPTYGTQISYWSTGVDELNRPVCDGWTYVGYLA